MGLTAEQKKERSVYLETALKITECSQRKPYVFISYASDNWETVFKTVVVPLQKQYGLRVYADKAFDKVNDKWIVPMLRNVRGSDVMVAFVSQSYIESYACFLELLTAINNKKQVVFVSLEEDLHLGDTTDQPIIERGAKNEILNQGANISTNTNNTSSDIMRAIKSAFTSLSTLLEQDALSKYDISDAFINFFRDAAINRKTINDLGAVYGTIRSISRAVFDKSLIDDASSQPALEPVHTPAPDPAAAKKAAPAPAEPAPVPATAKKAAPAPAEPAPVPATAERVEPVPIPVQVSAPVSQPASAHPPAPVPQPAPERLSVAPNNPAKSPLFPKLLIGAGAVAAAVIVLVAVLFRGGREKDPDTPGPNDGAAVSSSQGEPDTEQKPEIPLETVTNEFYSLEDDGKEGFFLLETEFPFQTGAYSGQWLNGKPHGTGTYVLTYPDMYMRLTYEGDWASGRTEGEGVLTLAYIYSDETVKEEGRYEGSFTGALCAQGTGKLTVEGVGTFEGEWKNGTPVDATFTAQDGSVFDGSFRLNEDGILAGSGTITYPDGGIYRGEWSVSDAGFVRSGTGRMTYVDGSVYEGEWENDQRNGTGKMLYPNGTIYEGEWKWDSRSG